MMTSHCEKYKVVFLCLVKVFKRGHLITRHMKSIKLAKGKQDLDETN